MKIGHPDRAHHAGKLGSLFQLLDCIAFDPRLRPGDDFYVRHRPLITRFSSECNEQSGFQGRRPNVFSDRQPGELVALFTRAIADLKAASGSPEISNDSKKSNSQRAVTAGPKIVTVCARLVFGTSQRY